MRHRVLAFPATLQTLAARQNQATLSVTAADYPLAEHDLAEFMTTTELDQAVTDTAFTARFEASVAHALRVAFDDSAVADPARLFLQRVLYRINRLKLFWYDDLANYDNENSHYLRDQHDRIESAWRAWEHTQCSDHAAKTVLPIPALSARARRDLDAPASEAGRYFRDHADHDDYCGLLEIVSLDALVEASQLSRTLGGTSNPVHAKLTRMLMEEYGGGNPERKHSAYFAAMLDELGVSSVAEAHFQQVPWEVLAAINLSFTLSERKRHFLRYIGGLLYTEVSTPSAFANYQAAADRLGLHRGRTSYWQLHIREDARHGQWMLHDIALPLCRQYPEHAWEIVYGYDQQRHVAGRAAAGILRAVRTNAAGAIRALE